MIDPTLAPVVKDASKAAFDLIKLVGGPAAEELGLFFRDKVREWRQDNAVRVAIKTQERLAKAGIAPKAIPARLLIPLIDGASTEDDPTLSDMWAGLLASAAGGLPPDQVLPNFAQILKSLSPLEAKVLDLMYQNERKGGTLTGFDGAEISRAWTLKTEICEQFHLPEFQFNLVIDNLIAIGVAQNGARLFGSTRMEHADRQEVGLTTLGTAFVAACNMDSVTIDVQPSK